LAQKQEYKSLAAKALLSVALVSDDHDKEKDLIAALHAASEVGLREVLAESAFASRGQRPAQVDIRRLSDTAVTRSQRIIYRASWLKLLSSNHP